MRRTLPLALFAGALLPVAAFAQPAGTSPFVIDRNRPDRLPDQPPTRPAREQPLQTPPVVQIDAAAAATPIRGIRFEGTEVPARVAAAAQSFLGKPANRAMLEALAKAMSDAYARANIALYTVLIPQQDMTGGQIRVLVAEGYIENVVITGEVERRKLALVKAYAERLQSEKPLTRLTLERYLSLIRDIPGLKLDARLLSGTGPGAVQLVLKLDYEASDFAFGFDNRTTRLFHDGQFNGSAKFYGLLREADQTELLGAASANLKEYQYLGLAHSTPLGANGTRLSLSGGYLRTRPRNSVIDGDAKTLAIGISHPLLRSYKRNLAGSISLDGLDSDNAAFGTLIAFERTRALRLALGYSDTEPKRAITVGATLSKGVNIFGARVIGPFAEAGFAKVNGRVTFDQAIGKQVVARLRASAQYTRDRLPAAERFAVGGADFGRAFDVAILNADRGIAALAELAWRPKLAKALEGSELYGFVDGATVDVKRREPFAGGNFSLASAGAGVRLAYGEKAALSVEAARSIEQPFPGTHDRWNISLGWRLSLGKP